MDGLSGAEVYDLTHQRIAGGDLQQRLGTIPHVKEIAHLGAIAENNRRQAAERAKEETWNHFAGVALEVRAGPVVVERAHAHHRQTEARAVRARIVLARKLAGP